MERQKIIASVIILIVASTAILGVIFLLQSNVGDEVEEEFVIEPHPFNYLNWWDIAWEIAENPAFSFTLRDIASFGSRWDGTVGYDQAAAWVVEELEKYNLEASLWGEHNTPVGFQPGYGSDNRAIVFGAHLDSYRSGSGINQNAAGCAVVMMIASALSRFRFPVDIYYCFFAGNLAILDPMAPIRMFYGSREVTSLLVTDEVDVIAFFNFDELLFRAPAQDENNRLQIQYRSAGNYQTSKYAADLLIQHMRRSGLDIMSTLQDTSIEGDQDAFWDNGYPAITVRSGHVINPRDPPIDAIDSEDYNFTQAVYLARAAASAGTYLALKGNGKPTSYKLEQPILVNESASIRTVMTVPQILTACGMVSTSSNLTLTISRGETVLSSTILGNGTFSVTTEAAVPIGPVTLNIENNGISNASIDMYMNYTSDTDGNEVLDSDQYTWPDPEPPLDWDKDGLSDIDERIVGTDIFVTDTDQDGLNDSAEVENGLEPLIQDTQEDYDSDSLTNLQEVNLGLDPLNNDTDQDGMLDGWEVYFKTNPFIDDTDLDPDNDTLTNIEEYTYGSDPHSVDGDSDGVSDVEEIENGMNPLDIDSDNDGLRDHLELLNGLNPLVPDYDVDLALDGPDHNPRINTIIILASIILVPVVIGSVILWRRIR